ncbi:4-hydroxy-tetrahydrodipicolinate synthase [Gammaproteobacteria bacterium]|nr:4-hydroxy-tetrahydrodipicolinate synthase [Gammaproteobacteria bacterium]MDB9907425.1 4-hydroxy-tetrahydrodipicolinate synthase [Gammaproteobacteria bacterium]MDC0090967.1 4-hydroxy-tetrahydrodipicolinate synthase [Gammaproteobacteria bacterium]
MQPLQGSFVALVTPMRADGSLDYESLEALIDWHIQSGTNGIVTVGTTGESATVSVTEHLQIIEKTIEFVNGRIPVIAGTGANSSKEALELTQTADSLGADFALIVTPYYNKPNQEGLYQHYMKIADSVEIPQILYNVPSRTACDLKPETVSRLSYHPNIVGIKEAVDDPLRLDELMSIRERVNDQKYFAVLSGDDPTFSKFMSTGGDGVISVAANILPSQVAKICWLNLEGHHEDAKELNEMYKNIFELLFIESNPIPVKWMLEQMMKVNSGIRLPLISLDSQYHDAIKNEMIKLKLL